MVPIGTQMKSLSPPGFLPLRCAAKFLIRIEVAEVLGRVIYSQQNLNNGRSKISLQDVKGVYVLIYADQEGKLMSQYKLIIE